MALGRTTAWIFGALSLLSLACLVLLYAALTDLWHMFGPVDIWSGTELGKAEWRFATLSYWPLVAFHVIWLGVAVRALLRSRRSEA